jgi:hypothetical protein
MLVGGGNNPNTNKAVLSKSTLDAVVTASAVVMDSSTDDSRSIEGSGMGWLRSSYMGHEASLKPDNGR